jgi:hypothetical protein
VHLFQHNFVYIIIMKIVCDIKEKNSSLVWFRGLGISLEKLIVINAN